MEGISGLRKRKKIAENRSSRLFRSKKSVYIKWKNRGFGLSRAGFVMIKRKRRVLKVGHKQNKWP
jgi:hypothetical protein